MKAQKRYSIPKKTRAWISRPSFHQREIGYGENYPMFFEAQGASITVI